MAHSSNEYMQHYRAKLKKKGLEFYEQSIDLLAEYVAEQKARGLDDDQIIDGFIQSTTPPDQQIGDDSTPEVKRDCFGTEKSQTCKGSCNSDCFKAYLTAIFRKPAVKEAEKQQKILDLLTQSKLLSEQIQRREDAERWARIQAQKDAEEKEHDALVKKYTDRGIDAATAEESATWEMKQNQNKKAEQYREYRRAWELKTDDEKTAFKMELLEKNRKLVRGDTEP